MLKLVVDNSDKFYDSFSGQYLEKDEMGFDWFLLDNETDESIACFATEKDAIIYQMGMGLRAQSYITNIWETEND